MAAIGRVVDFVTDVPGRIGSRMPGSQTITRLFPENKRQFLGYSAGAMVMGLVVLYVLYTRVWPMVM